MIRKFYLGFGPMNRKFKVMTAVRRVSKRNKRAPVRTCKGMEAYLVSRLSPETIADCLAQSILLNS